MIAFISDIHGNYPALKSVIREIDKLGCEKIFNLGDTVGYYCMINECIGEILKRDIYSLLGNHDYYLISGARCSSKTVGLTLDYQKTIIEDSYIKWIQTLKPLYDTEILSLRHGGWIDPLEDRFDNFDFDIHNYLKKKTFISGHSHIQKKEQKGDLVFCNPGSVGQPRDGDARASFAVLNDDGCISLHRVEYDIDEIVEAMKKEKQGDWIWKNLYFGKRIGA